MRLMLAERLAGTGVSSPAVVGFPEAPVAGLRIVVEKGGCAGMQYEMHFDAARPGDEVSESEGARVFVDAASVRFLEGASLDYCDDLVGTGFRLQNPRAARSCGCGTSFEPLEGGVGQEREATAVAHS